MSNDKIRRRKYRRTKILDIEGQRKPNPQCLLRGAIVISLGILVFFFFNYIIVQVLRCDQYLLFYFCLRRNKIENLLSRGLEELELKLFLKKTPVV